MRTFGGTLLLLLAATFAAHAVPIVNRLPNDLPAVPPRISSTLAAPAAPDPLGTLVSDLASLSPSAPAAMLPWTDLPEESSAGGETLAQVLRSIIIVHHEGDAADPVPAGAASPVFADNREDGLGWRQTILDSTSAGTTLRSLIDVHAEGGNPAGFSVLGIGNFRLELSPGYAPAGAPLITTDDRNELSHPVSFHVPGQLLGDVKPERMVTLLDQAFDFLASPLGVLVETTAALILTFWTIVRSIAVIRDLRPPIMRTLPGSDRPRRRRLRRRRRLQHQHQHQHLHQHRIGHRRRRRRRRRMVPTVT